MFHEHDVVILKKNLSGVGGLQRATTVPAGSQGTIVFVHGADGQAYEVEFFDQNNKTIDVFTVVGDENLELKWAYRDNQ